MKGRTQCGVGAEAVSAMRSVLAVAGRCCTPYVLRTFSVLRHKYYVLSTNCGGARDQRCTCLTFFYSPTLTGIDISRYS